jgi:putative DNA methylase
VAEAFASLAYTERLRHVRRPEECDERELLAPIWGEVSAHLGTTARSLPELVSELGIARFGRRPRVADAFCGGGSIPFEAARIGCDVYASDLNPIACMLTWGAFNIVGADEETRDKIAKAQQEVASAVDEQITKLGIEHDKDGNRAKAFLYCLETRCPKSGWMVPMAPSWIVSTSENVVAKLVPDHSLKRYRIEIRSGVSESEMAEAAQGTVRSGRLVHPMNPERTGVEISTIRGDSRDEKNVNRNKLRLWTESDFLPRPDDIFQERLYCIQWITNDTLDKSRQETFFAAPANQGLARERKVETIVAENLWRWQDEGIVPDMSIEPGANTSQPIWERGWTHWHHLFGARDLLKLCIANREGRRNPALTLNLCSLLDFQSKLSRWIIRHRGTGGSEFTSNVFSNMALNTLFNWGNRSWAALEYAAAYRASRIFAHVHVEPHDAKEIKTVNDIYITDPPYADAINYHEITEYFIAWLRKNPPPPFDKWDWSSHRELAIKGKDEGFRRDMVAAYAAMTRHMPDNGMQVVMFTHLDAGVWADLGTILWAAGLKVCSAWNVRTETEKLGGEGNYVQGTVCLALRKRLNEANARRMEIEAEIEDAVRAQLERLLALDGARRAQPLYTDGDLTLAAYAAALQVVTSYSTIDRQRLDRDIYRKLAKNERTMIRELIDYAAHVANGLLVPEGFPREAWRSLESPARFYIRMLDSEAKGIAKVGDFEIFARAFAFADYAELMASTAANAASLAGAADLKGRMLDGDGFANTPLRQVLFAIWKTMERGDPKTGVMVLRGEYAADYWTRRQRLIGLAEYISAKTARTRPKESAAAHELAEALKLDKV